MGTANMNPPRRPRFGGNGAGAGCGDRGDNFYVPFGSDPELLKALICFYWIGRAYGKHARSLTRVAAVLEAMQIAGEIPGNVAVSIVSVKQAATKVRQFFGKHFSCDGLAPLFICEGQSFTGLSELGETAWELTGDWMDKHGFPTKKN